MVESGRSNGLQWRHIEIENVHDGLENGGEYR